MEIDHNIIYQYVYIKFLREAKAKFEMSFHLCVSRNLEANTNRRCLSESTSLCIHGLCVRGQSREQVRLKPDFPATLILTLSLVQYLMLILRICTSQRPK